MAPLIIYGTATSPPTRAVWLAAKAMGLEWEHKEVNLMIKEQLKPEYIKMNPQHTVPVLNDNGLIIWESHAIMAYLVDQYDANSSLYPIDPAKRAIINQRMHFDSDVVFGCLRSVCFPMFLYNEKSITERTLKQVYEMYDFVNSFLKGNLWVCGDHLTIADFGLLAEMTSFNGILPVDAKKYPNIGRWIKRAKALPYFNKVNEEGVKLFHQIVGGAMKQFE